MQSVFTVFLKDIFYRQSNKRILFSVHEKFRVFCFFNRMLDVIFFLYLCPNLGQLTVWKIQYKHLTFPLILYYVIRYYYENDASYLFCAAGSCKMNPDFSQAKTTRNNTRNYHRCSWKFVCICCVFVKTLLNSHLQKK